MPVKDLRSDIKVVTAQIDVISTDTTTDGAIIDTSHYENGVAFSYVAAAWTDGTYTPLLEESATGAFAGEETPIADANLIGTEAGAAISAASVELGVQGTIGIFSTLQFVRSTLVSTGTSTGATIVVSAIVAPELIPSPDLSA
jgi:hypothetical protein